MDDFSQEASKAEEIAYESKQTRYRRKTRLTCEEHPMPGTIFTSPWIEFVTPWMDTNRYPDTSFANTIAQKASPLMNASKHSDSHSLSSSTQTWFAEYKVDLWFKSTPARPGQSSTSCPNTRDTASTSVDGDKSQLSKQKTEDTSFDFTGASALARLPDSSLDSVQQPLVPQMDGSTEVPDSPAANQSELQTARLSTRDPFFDSVPKGPSQLSISRWDARFPTFNPLDSTRNQAPASPWDKTATSFGSGKHP